MDPITVSSDESVAPPEIIDLQQRAGSAGWGIGNETIWQDAIDRAISVVTARDSDDLLVGVGFLIGNLRHADVCDVIVDPAFRRQGIGHRISTEIVGQIREHKIRYVSLVRDPANPYLEAFYASVGFETIDFAVGLINEADSPSHPSA